MNYPYGRGGIMRRYRNKNQLLILFLVVGFFVGIIYENVVSGKQVDTVELFLKSNLQLYLQTEIITQKYLWYVVKERLLLLGVVCLLGCSKWKKIFVILFLSGVGFISGMLVVSAVLQLGMKGILIFFAGVFPQMIFYGIAYSVLLLYWYQGEGRRWNHIKTVFVFVSFILGIVVEVYLNPIILKWMIRICTLN